MATQHRLSPLDVLVLSAWWGLAGGLLEVGTRVVCKILPVHRMYSMSRHFIWMAPLSNLLLFTGIGLFLALATKFWPGHGSWLFSRLACSVAILPVLIVMSRGRVDLGGCPPRPLTEPDVPVKGIRLVTLWRCPSHDPLAHCQT